MPPYRCLEDERGWFYLASNRRPTYKFSTKIRREMSDDDYFANIPESPLRKRVANLCRYYLGLPVQWLHDLTNKLGAHCDELEL